MPEYDVFISYSHVDNAPISGADQGWVSTLVKNLEILLAQKIGRSEKVKLWFDERNLSRTGEITDQIVEMLSSTSILIAVLSKGYLESISCREERKGFLKKHPNGKIFIVKRDKIRLNEQPFVFREKRGYQFYEDRPGKSTRIFGEPRPDPNDRRYYDVLTDLANDIANELKKPILQRGEPHDEQGKADTRLSVYLSETTDDLEPERSEVERRLKQEGFRVLPKNPHLPKFLTEPNKIHSVIEKEIRKAKIFVQLLSNVTGKKPRGHHSFGEVQYEQAKKAGKAIFQWRDPHMNMESITNDKRKELLESETVFAISLESFKNEIVKQAKLNLKPKPNIETSTSSGLIFLNADQIDLSLARRIIRIIEENGLGHILPKYKGIPSEIQKDFEENVLCCDGMIVVYGAATSWWARSQLKNCHKISLRRDQPLRAFAVYEGPPPNKEPLDVVLPGMYIINCRKCLKKREIEPFMSALKAGGIS